MENLLKLVEEQGRVPTYDLSNAQLVEAGDLVLNNALVFTRHYTDIYGNSTPTAVEYVELNNENKVGEN